VAAPIFAALVTLAKGRIQRQRKMFLLNCGNWQVARIRSDPRKNDLGVATFAE